MKNKNYWKVVRETSPKVYSSCIVKAMNSCTYSTTEFTTSKVKPNGLFVFKTRNQARMFKASEQGGKDWKIFKVQVDGLEIPNPIYYSPYNMMYDRYIETGYDFPRGTTTFEKVKLIKQQ